MKKILKIHLQQKRNDRGFTLIELVLYLGLFSIMILLITEVFLAVLDSQLESKATSGVSEDGRFILARLLFDIANADTLITPINIGDVSNNLQITRSGINYTYSLTNGNLELNNNLGMNMLNSYDTQLSDVSFTRIGNTSGKPSVRISYTVSSRTIRKGILESKSFQTTISLR